MAGPDDRAYGRGTTPYTKPKKKKQQIGPAATRERQPRQEPAPVRPKPPPVPVLQKHGFHEPLPVFTERLRAFTQSYESIHGFRPSPGLAFDMARSKVAPEKFEQLFSVPASRRNAQLFKPTIPEMVAETVRQMPLTDEELEGNLVDDFLAHVRLGKEDEYLRGDHGPDVLRLLETRPALKAKLIRARFDERRERVEHAGGDLPVEAAGIFMKGGLQVISGLTLGPPTLALEEGKGVKKSVEQRSLVPLAQTNVDLGKAVATGIYEDFRHPGENPGYLFLDLLGITAVLRSGGKRVNKARKAEGAKAKGKALVKKPLGGTVEIRRGGKVEHELLSENPLVADAQKVLAKVRNKRVAARMEGTAPGGLVSVLRPKRAADVIDGWMDDLVRSSFSSETKIGRLGASRRRVEMAIENAAVNELRHVARATPMQQRINRFLPQKLRTGLTVGEQKALQVKFSDLEGDDLAKLRQWREFHENMIEMAPVWVEKLGYSEDFVPMFVQEHNAQLAALKLAEKALEGKPSPRFQRAEQLVRELEAEATVRKMVQFGLTPFTAAGRIAAEGEVVRTKGLREGTTEQVTSSAIYSPKISRGKTRKQTKIEERLVAGPRAGRFGIPLPDTRRWLPELHHEFTGKSLIKGDYRIDTTNLTAENVGAVYRATAIVDEYKALLKSSTDRPTGSGFDMPIRTGKKIPERLREILARVEEGHLTDDDAKWLSSAERADLVKHLFPGRRDPQTGKWKFDPGEVEIDGVKWVDSRTVLGMDRLPNLPDTWGKKAFQSINEPFRALYLFARPAYALNIPGNVGMLLMQSAFAPVNVARAIGAEKIYGKRVTIALDELMGGGRFKSMVAPEVNALNLGSNQLAGLWHVIADRPFRRAALIHEIQRQGFKGRKGFEEFLFSKEHEVKRVESVRRGKKAVVEFDNLREFEKHSLRHAIFVYPWVSRSAVWSLRTIVEHPMKSAILAELGEQTLEDMDEFLSQVPEWFKRTGYLPISWNEDGSPRVINPQSINSFSTLNELKTVGEGLIVRDVQDTGLGEMLGPGAKYLTFLASGHDEFGNPLPGPDFVGAFNELVKTLPQYRAWKRQGEYEARNKDVPRDITDRRTLIKEQRGALERMVLGPGWLDGWGTLITGGLTPRDVDQEALIARFWRDQSPEERHKMEMGLIRQGLKLQGEFLKKAVPPEVRNAVEVAEAWKWAKSQKQRETGQEGLSPRQRNELLIDALVEKGKVDDAGTLRKQLKGLVGESEHNRFRDALLLRYANARELQEWDADVRTVYSFRREIVQHKLDILAAQGIVPKQKVPNDQETLNEIGRKYLAWKKEVVRREAEISALAGTEKKAAEAELRAWEQSQDVTKGFPSFVRYQWAEQTEKQRREHLRSISLGDWQTLSSFDKELLGKNARYGEAWAVYQSAITDYLKAAPFDERVVKADQRLDLAKQVNKSYPGFIRDWDFARRRKFARLRELKPIRESKNQQDWLWLFEQANTFARAIDDKVITEKDAKEQWKDAINQLRPWIRENLPKFDAELRVYESQRKTFLNSLLERGRP